MDKRKDRDESTKEPAVKIRKLITEFYGPSIDLLEYYPPYPVLQKITRPKLDIDYGILFPSRIADLLFAQLMRETEFLTGDLARCRVRGRWYPLKRKHSAYGLPGIQYTFSGVSLPAKEFTPLLLQLKKIVQNISHCNFNFVLINYYESGLIGLGHHRDNEPGLRVDSPIVSISLGQPRDFEIKSCYTQTPPIKLRLQSGSYLALNPPTNQHFSHALLPDSKALKPKLNLSFRKNLENPTT